MTGDASPIEDACMTKQGITFVQVTDAHICATDVEGNATIELCAVPRGDEIIPPRYREYLAGLTAGHLAEAAREIGALDPEPAFILFTGDQTTCGTRGEWEHFLDVIEPLDMARYYNTSNHDLGATPEVFEELVGPRRTTFDAGGLRFFIMDEYRRSPGDPYPWKTRALPEHYDWIGERLGDETSPPCVLVTHAPILPTGDDRFAEKWDHPSTTKFVGFLARSGFRWHISGHWHRNMTWDLGGITAINTGALGGFQCSGPEPFFLFPVRPGYRMFHWDGVTLRSFWRTLRAWIETSVTFIGDAHGHGPRPQVRTVTVGAPVDIQVQAYAPGERIEAVEWGLAVNVSDTTYSAVPVMHASGWRPMKRTWDGLWSEWEAPFDPGGVAPGEYVLLSRAKRRSDNEWYGHDAVPLSVSSDRDTPARADAERLFALFDGPRDAGVGRRSTQATEEGN